MCIKSHLRTSAAVWGLSGQPAGSFSLHVWLFCSVLSVCEKEVEEGEEKKKKNSSWVVTVCSALPPRSPETSLEMEMEGCNIRVIIFGAPMAPQRAAWGHRHPLPRVRKWAVPGKALSRRVGGWADSRGAAAAVFIRQPRRAQTARTHSGVQHRQRLDSDT